MPRCLGEDAQVGLQGSSHTRAITFPGERQRASRRPNSTWFTHHFWRYCVKSLNNLHCPRAENINCQTIRGPISNGFDTSEAVFSILESEGKALEPTSVVSGERGALGQTCRRSRPHNLSFPYHFRKGQLPCQEACVG